MKTILTFMFQFGACMITALPLSLFVRFMAALRMKKLDIFTTKRHEIASALLIMYFGGIAGLTIATDPSLLTFDITKWQINLIPFNFIYEILFGCYRGNAITALINIAGNIIVFIPAGFLVALIWHKASWYKSTGLCAAASILIELCQLPQPSRVTDIDDVILNSLGGLLGYLLYKLIKPSITAKYKVIK